jgi:hypothetical protein
MSYLAKALLSLIVHRSCFVTSPIVFITHPVAHSCLSVHWTILWGLEFLFCSFCAPLCPVHVNKIIPGEWLGGSNERSLMSSQQTWQVGKERKCNTARPHHFPRMHGSEAAEAGFGASPVWLGPKALTLSHHCYGLNMTPKFMCWKLNP